ncbi:glycine cleavage system protein GcvH [Spirochaeta lutea]|uniref:Glycine cleavage system H protein n=1 Tax=Spirochaeta lutea TaxID=1480694 RepID=A0A098QZL4_9SPIO|nr:glycine cleavage system protein GcvH [Spirochaeta lutea]KGE71927.1 glycine cleavage system protein H [Spirochaeta lutea]
MTFDETVRYQDSHEWARKDGDFYVIGISDFAQDSLGDVVFVEFPELGATLKKGSAFGVVESVKAASDVFMPLGGEVVEINTVLKDSPEKINQDPFGDGWILKIKATSDQDFQNLMDAEEYKNYTKDLDD